MRRNLYFNLDDPIHKRAFEIYNSKRNKADFVCQAILAYEENTSERWEERIRRVEEKVDTLLQNRSNKNTDQRIDGILEMHNLFKSE